MNKSLGTFMVTIPFALSFAGVAQAQLPVAQPQPIFPAQSQAQFQAQFPAQPQAQAQPEKIPVKLQFVISTYEGDRKVSSIPYTLLATANGGMATLLNGTNVPIPSGDGKYSYTNVGTTIVCTVTTEGGNFKIAINFDEKSVVAAKPPVAPASPTFHDINYVSTITIKEGETKQLISATDKATGEVVKVDVTLTLDPPRRASIDTMSRGAEIIEIPLSLN